MNDKEKIKQAIEWVNY